MKTISTSYIEKLICTLQVVSISTQKNKFPLISKYMILYYIKENLYLSIFEYIIEGSL
jgi:hypothetical protein